MGGFFIMLRQLLILAAAALWPFSAQAVDTAKEGTEKLIVRFVNVSSLSEMKQGYAVVYTNDNSGIQNASAGSLFDNLGVRCVGFTRVGATGASKGYCVKGDSDGNQYWEEFQDLAGKGTSKIVGGQGKFAGMTGDIDYSYEGAVGDPNGRTLFVVYETVRWKLP
jgi:hypothetical protein